MTKPKAIAILALFVGVLIAWGRLAAHYAEPRFVVQRVEVPVPQPASSCIPPLGMTTLGPCDEVVHHPSGDTECTCATRSEIDRTGFESVSTVGFFFRCDDVRGRQ